MQNENVKFKIIKSPVFLLVIILLIVYLGSGLMSAVDDLAGSKSLYQSCRDGTVTPTEDEDILAPPGVKTEWVAPRTTSLCENYTISALTGRLTAAVFLAPLKNLNDILIDWNVGKN